MFHHIETHLGKLISKLDKKTVSKFTYSFLTMRLILDQKARMTNQHTLFVNNLITTGCNLFFLS